MEHPESPGFFDEESEASWNFLRNAWREATGCAHPGSLQKTLRKVPSTSCEQSEQAPESETSCVEDVVQRVRAKPLDMQLKYLTRYFKSLDPVLNACEMKLRGIKNRVVPLDVLEPSVDCTMTPEARTTTSLDSTVAYAQRIASHLRAPPEYSDPTGTDPYCVPGYFFPCPDTATMRRSSLFYTHLPRALPPTILLKEDAATPSVYWITLSTETHRAQILYAINQSTTWNLYNEERKPYVTAPGNYVIHSYCQATGHLVSETAVSQINLSPKAAPQSQALHHTRKPLDWGTEIEGSSKKRQKTREYPNEAVSAPSGPVNGMDAQSTTQVDAQAKLAEAELAAESAQSSSTASNTGTSDIKKVADEKASSDPPLQDVQLKEATLMKPKPSGLGRFSGLFLSTGDTKNDSDSQSDSEASEDE